VADYYSSRVDTPHLPLIHHTVHLYCFRLSKAEKELKDANGARMYAEGQVEDLRGKCNLAESQRKLFEDENKVRVTHTTDC